MSPDVVLWTLAAENVTRRVPTVPESTRFANVAAPEASVVCVVVPVSVPPPDDTAAVTATPAVGTGFPWASTSLTIVADENGIPLRTDTGGACVIDRRIAAPGNAVASMTS